MAFSANEHVGNHVLRNQPGKDSRHVSQPDMSGRPTHVVTQKGSRMDSQKGSINR